MNIQGKVWGRTSPLFLHSNVEINKVHIFDGGFCSKHRHVAKFNMFVVFQGILKIRVWKNDYDLVDITEIGPGECTTVKPGEYHSFEALGTVDALEVYWVELDPGDIERETVGGMNPE